MKKIVLTGGGTAGHVTPNLAMVDSLKAAGYDIEYIGSYEGIEKSLAADYGLKYHGIATGKLRRYFDIKNFTDPFRVIKGFSQASKLMKEIKPDVIFSKGGFVSVPVVVAAGRKRIPVIIHESDMTPGLANKISFKYATKICCNFPETVDKLPKDKAVLSGTPIRKELFTGDKEQAKKFCGFTDDKPVIMVMGGSLGAVAVNKAVRNILPELLKDFNVVHLCGKGKLDESLLNTPNYVQFEYIKDELKDLFALSDILISRAGANAICEIAALAIPNVLIPLPADVSRGDQVLNAESFKKQGFSEVIDEHEITDEKLYKMIQDVYTERDKYIKAMKASSQTDAVTLIVDLINTLAK
ncbi:MAG: undecaprenyldiphospho-muramoylpentapeptide beta-N-acetylglucosaminyltransferase [Lachnospiraceae bacterium]|nr:undecaprenyldiphospho-muramoylpentapeptide beta-N-acetylglucosaminyltransferase [Lachnospiraceae bacterium]